MSRRSNKQYKPLSSTDEEHIEKESQTLLKRATQIAEHFTDSINEKIILIVSVTCVLLCFIVFVVSSLLGDKNDPQAKLGSKILLFESSEFDFYLNELPMKFSDAAQVVKASNSRFLDYRVLRPDFMSKLEDSLSKNARNLTKMTFWTAAYYDFTESISHDDLRYIDDSTVGKLANFPGVYHGQCRSAEYYEGYIENEIHKMTKPKIFQIAIQLSCEINGEVKVCKSCLTLLAKNSATHHLLVSYKPKLLPKINLKKNFLKIRSSDDKLDFVFHEEKVSREGLEKVVNHLEAAKLPSSVFEPKNFERISMKFKNSTIQGKDHEMVYWTSGFFNFSSKRPNALHWDKHIYDMDQVNHWCGQDFITDEPKTKIKELYHDFIFDMENQRSIVNVVLRVKDYYHQTLWDEPPCLLIDDGKEKSQTGEALFQLAYAISLRR